VNVSGETEIKSDGAYFVQVAQITVKQPGRYHLAVKPVDESGGSLALGDVPVAGASSKGIVRAAIVLVFTPVLLALLARRRRR